jgi:hypothetical protein
MTTTERTSPRGLRDHFAGVRARRHASRAIDATEDVETNLREILGRGFRRDGGPHPRALRDLLTQAPSDRPIDRVEAPLRHFGTGTTMAKTRCSVFDDGADARRTTPATMVGSTREGRAFNRTTARDTREDHGAVVIDVALRIRRLRDHTLRRKDEHGVNACDKALLGNELAIDECVAEIAQADPDGTADPGARR